MTGDEPKWLDDFVRSSDTAGFELRKASSMYEGDQIYCTVGTSDFDAQMSGI